MSEPVRYRNPFGRLALIVATVGLLPVALVGGLLLGVVRYFGWIGQAGMTVLLYLLLYALWSFFLFDSVDIEPGRVVLYAPFRRIVIGAAEVSQIELEPPVRSLSMEISWGKQWSKFVIHRKGAYPIDASGMPDGLKLRIANALDPTNFSLPGEL